MSIAEHYRILGPLGKQKIRKFGEVYLVEHRITGIRGVLKAARVESSHIKAMERLRAEAQFDFSHEGLPKTLDFFESDQEVLLIRSYAEGIPLDEFWTSLRKKEQLNFLRDFIRKMIPHFEVLKDRGIVHCDLKPANILIEGSSIHFKVHVIDFGLAIETKAPEARSLVFPLGYAAPELLLNQLDLVDSRSDIFALGTIIWRLFAGHLPLAHPNPSIFTNLQLTHPLPDHPSLPKGLYPILEQMCCKHRFQLPPNRMEINEVKDHLLQARDRRYSNLDLILNDLEKLPKIPFYQRMSFR